MTTQCIFSVFIISSSVASLSCAQCAITSHRGTGEPHSLPSCVPLDERAGLTGAVNRCGYGYGCGQCILPLIGVFEYCDDEEEREMVLGCLQNMLKSDEECVKEFLRIKGRERLQATDYAHHLRSKVTILLESTEPPKQQLPE